MAKRLNGVLVVRGAGRPTAWQEANTAWAVAIANEVQRQQVEKGFVATGDSLDEYIVRVLKSEVNVTMAHYIAYLTKGTGRMPGTMPPVDVIATWIKVKGIEPEEGSIEDLAWAIAKKMEQEGNVVYQHPNKGIDLMGAIDQAWREEANSIGLIVANRAAEDLTISFQKKGFKVT